IGAAAQTYCGSASTSSTDSDIIDVQLGAISNNTASSACATYTYFSNLSTDLNVGDNYQLYIQLGVHSGCGGAGFTKSARGWIDFNHDGDFDDPGELLGGISYSSGTFSGTVDFQVPCNAVSGVTRMRIVCQENTTANIQPCGTYSYG